MVKKNRIIGCILYYYELVLIRIISKIEKKKGIFLYHKYFIEKS